MARLQDHSMKNDFLDLKSRLEHLITYSSQLVFVSGEGMGKQLNFAQHFLSQQNELANIGYVDANSKLDIISYRKKVIQQLVGAVRVDYSKPLTFLVPRLLKENSQFILIAVTHADLLPDEFLQELWDLVLQNRFAKNRHHLNILVFGEKAWASRAKSWLPANSNNKPVLLANESVERSAQESMQMSELDQLISTKRQQFNERLALRESTGYVEAGPLSQWWVKVALSIIFFVTFFGILLWRYVTLDQARSFYDSIFAGSSSVVELAENQVTDNELSVTGETMTEDTDAGDVLEERVDEVPAFLQLAEDQRRVVEWDDAVKSLPEAPLVITNEEAPLDSQDSSDNTEESFSVSDETASNSQLNETVAEDSSALSNGDEFGVNENEALADEFDYPVEDITSVEQLDRLTSDSLDDSVESNGDDTLSVAEESPTEVGSESETARDAEFEFDEATLEALDTAGFVLQLSAMSTREALTFYLQTNQLAESSWVYKTQRFGGDWFVVLHNEVFDSLQSANNAIQRLGLSTSPFAKPIDNVQQEITQSE